MVYLEVLGQTSHRHEHSQGTCDINCDHGVKPAAKSLAHASPWEYEL